ncbi:hypothetical protein E2C01_036445 [Portunus trituberculatus]|uniref:Uncharacterized protein n=1 Tax=Portunus trituberculatus TaxID=210409 RepID=A0A5B7FE73_PORTR|nr:hypothetical protein [Portunus trituberculatus]
MKSGRKELEIQKQNFSVPSLTSSPTIHLTLHPPDSLDDLTSSDHSSYTHRPPCLLQPTTTSARLSRPLEDLSTNTTP